MIDLTALPDPADHPLAMLIVAQLVVLPTLTAAAARLVRSHPARAHAVITAGLLATVGAPPLTLLAASAGLGFLPGLEITPSAPALAGADDVDDARATDMLHRVTTGTRRATLCRTDEIESPAIFCWCRVPRILLPSSLAPGSDPRMLEQMLTHEVAHLDRRDHWWRLVAELAACLLPWHPVVWSLRRAVYETSEMACDARVLQGDDRPEQYAQTLLQLSPCRTVQLPALHAVRASTKLGRRIRAILHPRRASDRSGTAALALIVAGAVTVTAAAALAQRRPLVVVTPDGAPTPLVAIEAVPNELDLGRVAPGSSAEGFIHLVNIGATPVTVDGQKAACGCTTVEPVKGRTIAPGDVLEVPIKLDAPDTPDTERRRKVTFFFQELDPMEVHVRLHTTGP